MPSWGVRDATRHGYFQVTTDGFAPYRSAITLTLHDRADYAMLIKVCAANPEGERKYSPAEVASTVGKSQVMGRSDPDLAFAPASWNART